MSIKAIIVISVVVVILAAIVFVQVKNRKK